MTPRVLDLPPERFPAWLDTVIVEHPDAVVARDDAVTTVTWPGGRARCEAFSHDPLGLILVRRGGYAVGLAIAGRLAALKAGRRHVQSRTAAGGWSQQRFARRRQGQADVLVVGGDRGLVGAVLADRRIPGIRDLPRREVPGLPDPDARVLTRALWLGRAVRVALEDTGAHHRRPRP